jgi:hypothetical protein
MKRTSIASAWASVSVVLALATWAYGQYTSNPPFRLAQDTPAAKAETGAARQTTAAPAKTETPATTREEVISSQTETETTLPPCQDWDIFGPIRLRAADPQPVGEVEAKFTTEWGTSSSGQHDSVSIEPEIEYGIAPNHELIWAIPLELGLGGVDGNADQEIGWHWRLWKEDYCGWLPAFAIRNILRIPSGYHSSGVDWTFKGLITKSIIPNKFRVHLNPWFESVNGNNLEAEAGTKPIFFAPAPRGLFGRDTEEHRFFRWGIIPGMDYKICENLDFIADYVYENSPYKGQRDQHSLEFDLDWEIDEHNELAIVTRIGVDGDSIGDNFAIGITYAYVFKDVPHLGEECCVKTK